MLISFCITVIRVASVFFFNDTATTEIYTLSLHDALPICNGLGNGRNGKKRRRINWAAIALDRKSTRLNSSHSQISYAVFCLKKKSESRRVHGRVRSQTHRGDRCAGELQRDGGTARSAEVT